uniref:Uncharacterized protein n=1 Tax=Panagrolaimus sp. PS1159 TaxID=55785 RepID=A0AC35GL50_9BILA
MSDTAEKAVRDHYSGIVPNSGNECNEISMEMEGKFGGFWMVSIFDSDYDIAYTISRRSRSYGLFGIDDRIVLIARDGGKRPNFGPVWKK